MKTQRKVLIQELLETLAPHLAGTLKADGKPGKALSKSIQQLAEQLLRARAKQHKRATRPASPAPLVTEQQLTATLLTALDADLAGDYAGKKAAKAIEASAEHLAGKLAKLRHKQKKAPLGALPTETTTTNADADTGSADAVPAAPARPTPPRRPTAGGRRPPRAGSEPPAAIPE